MQNACSAALKEWAVVCAALAEGRQSLLLRTGGIAESRGGFAVEHPEFWLFPTRFHQSADELKGDAEPLLEEVCRSQPPQGIVRLSLFASVEAIHRITDRSRLSRLEGLHILSPDTIHSRFDYRQPGLYVLTVRVYRQPTPHEIVDAPRYAGCHSWVDLDQSLSTGQLEPVIPDDEFAARVEDIHSRLPTDGSET